MHNYRVLFSVKEIINRAVRRPAERREASPNHRPWAVLSLRLTLLVLAVESTTDLPRMGGWQLLGRDQVLLRVHNRLTVHSGPAFESWWGRHTEKE